MPAAYLKPEIVKLIEERHWSALKESLARLPAPEVAELLPELEKPDRVLLFRALPRELAADAVAHMEAGERDALLRELTDEETRQLLANLSPDDRTEVLSELPGQVTRRLLNLLSPEDLREARHLLGYPEESVGRLMTPDYVAVRPDWTVSRALEHVRKHGRDSETINVLYVTDRAGMLLGMVELRKLILASPEAAIEQVMSTGVESLKAYDDREQAVRLVERYDLSVLPVVDSDGILLGIVTVDDVMDVAEEEATEDFQKMGTVEPIRVSLKEAKISLLYRRRIGWLLGLVVVNIFAGAALAYYEATLAQVLALVFFLPLLIDSAGNAGSQSATLMVRALATGDVEVRDWFWLLGRELAVASAMGLTMGLAVSVLGIFRGGPDVAVVASITMVLVVVIGSLVGMSLPFALHRFKMDPATASAPLITSIADILGIVVYLAIATWYLGIGT
jgi:magnesium transporter